MRLASILFFIFLAFTNIALAVDQSNNDSFQSIQALAMKKDYQAQRNLAYGYTSWPYQGQDKNPILGCAWYQLILNSGSPKVNQGDIGNVTVYCEKLDAKSQSAALAQARVLYKTIYKTPAKF
ncbi:MAG: hypothetical protein PHY54_12365 [Methylococcales bacterium]|nr:hypothetical protein [Methylococcales bacterium]